MLGHVCLHSNKRCWILPTPVNACFDSCGDCRVGVLFFGGEGGSRLKRHPPSNHVPARDSRERGNSSSARTGGPEMPLPSFGLHVGRLTAGGRLDLLFPTAGRSSVSSSLSREREKKGKKGGTSAAEERRQTAGCCRSLARSERDFLGGRPHGEQRKIKGVEGKSEKSGFPGIGYRHVRAVGWLGSVLWGDGETAGGCVLLGMWFARVLAVICVKNREDCLKVWEHCPPSHRVGDVKHKVDETRLRSWRQRNGSEKRGATEVWGVREGSRENGIVDGRGWNSPPIRKIRWCIFGLAVYFQGCRSLVFRGLEAAWPKGSSFLYIS